MMYAYALEDPLSDADVTFFNNPHGSKPVYIVHRSKFTQDLPADVKIWDLMNFEVVHFSLAIYSAPVVELSPQASAHHPHSIF